MLHDAAVLQLPATTTRRKKRNFGDRCETGGLSSTHLSRNSRQMRSRGTLSRFETSFLSSSTLMSGWTLSWKSPPVVRLIWMDMCVPHPWEMRPLPLPPLSSIAPAPAGCHLDPWAEAALPLDGPRISTAAPIPHTIIIGRRRGRRGGDGARMHPQTHGTPVGNSARDPPARRHADSAPFGDTIGGWKQDHGRSDYRLAACTSVPLHRTTVTDCRPCAIETEACETRTRRSRI